MTPEEFEDLVDNQLFINLNDDIDKIYFGQITRAEKDCFEVLWTSPRPGDEHPGIRRYEFGEFLESFQLFLDVDRKNRTFKSKKNEELRIKCKNWFRVTNVIYDSPQHRISKDQCVELIKQKLAISKGDAVAILKLFVATQKLFYLKNSTGEHIGLPPDILALEHKKRYLSSLSSEIQSQSKRIEFIMGHGQTIGNYREKLFMTVLRKYVPTKFHVATGFIEGVEKQIDILIYDQHNYLPVFREDDLVVVKPESVVAAIEIKSTLDAKTLKNSLAGISEISRLLTSIPFFKGIFAFKSTFRTDTALAKNIISFYSENGIEAIYNHFDVICVPDRHCFKVQYEKNKSSYCPLLGSLDSIKEINIEESYFFQQLFSFLDIESNAKKVNNSFFKELSRTATTKKWEYLTDESWFPHSTFLSEYDSVKHLDLVSQLDEVISVNKSNALNRINTIESWRSGTLSRDEVVKRFNNN